MIRKIIVIDREKCNGCGLCASACAEGAIAMVDGKAELIRDDYCDGLGNCLPACPTGAISFEEREAAAYDEEAVKRHLESREAERAAEASRQEEPLACGCPGSMSRSIQRGEVGKSAPAAGRPAAPEPASELRQWPVQIQLAPVTAPYFQNANLLVAADCTAYARRDFHSRFIRGRVVLVGCPKLDPVEADGDHPPQRDQERHRRAHGGALLRRPGAGGEECPDGQRQIPALAGGDHLRERGDPGMRGAEE